MYDYGFRIYNPRLGKFLSVDPLTKEYPELTPYQFASNSPIEYIDLDGCEGVRPSTPPRRIAIPNYNNTLPPGYNIYRIYRPIYRPQGALVRGTNGNEYYEFEGASIIKP